MQLTLDLQLIYSFNSTYCKPTRLPMLMLTVNSHRPANIVHAERGARLCQKGLAKMTLSLSLQCHLVCHSDLNWFGAGVNSRE